MQNAEILSRICVSFRYSQVFAAQGFLTCFTPKIAILWKILLKSS